MSSASYAVLLVLTRSSTRRTAMAAMGDPLLLAVLAAVALILPFASKCSTC